MHVANDLCFVPNGITCVGFNFPNNNCFLQSKCNRPCPVIQISRDAIRKGKFYFGMERLTFFQVKIVKIEKFEEKEYYQLNFLNFCYKTVNHNKLIYLYFNGSIRFPS